MVHMQLEELFGFGCTCAPETYGANPGHGGRFADRPANLPPCKPADRPAASSSTLVGEYPTDTFTYDDGCHAAWNTPT